MKKIAIIGKGTAGSFALTHFTKWAKNTEIDFYYDPNTKAQTVGEGSNLALSLGLYKNIQFNYCDLEKIDGTFKEGIRKINWGQNGGDFFHPFPPPSISYHFNAVKFQEFIFNKFKDDRKINFIEKNVTHKEIDADFIMDCSGNPKDYSTCFESKYICVNAVHVTQCFWEYPKFQYTLTIARPYGWVFGIPLKNRCAIGYMYNHNINTLEEVKDDVKEIFKEWNLIPSNTTNSFHFKNYFRKENYVGRVAYNGNASFFLEPMEATSISTMDRIQRMAYDIWFDGSSIKDKNLIYNTELTRLEQMIMLHYCAGSKFKSKFWDFAMARGEASITTAFNDPFFNYMMEKSKLDYGDINESVDFGIWPLTSFKQNLLGLNLYDKLEKIKSKVVNTNMRD